LSYLKRLPVDKLKIDRSFVMGIPQDSNDMAITRAILALGHSLRLTVLAEGVETREQAAFLKVMGCNEAQGYHYSKPVDAESFQTLLDGKHKEIGGAATT
jgi:EAL domain-containing protein (putative c-di-GMP-specific phosphodiesterase class I)